MFIQPCFIRKNTPELREKLRNMGYEYHGKENITDNLSSLHCCNGWYYECNLVPLDYYSIAYCGTNEELFLAIAALRDDTDKNQRFVLDTNLLFSPNGIEHPIGSFIKCCGDKWYVDYNIDGTPCEFSSRNIPAHKATVQELIEHFIDK